MPPVVQTLASRAAAGRRAHQEWQGSRAEEDAGFMAEKRLEVQLEISGWTCVIQGRVDGLTEVAGRLVVCRVPGDHDGRDT